MKKNKRVVYPENFTGYNLTLLSIFGIGPKFTIKCGECSYVFKDRIPLIDYPTVLCPHCDALNQFPFTVTTESDEIKRIDGRTR
jgi:phage FluMu protein Com